jgi:sulfite reductase beta subunit-like hemoprotein
MPATLRELRINGIYTQRDGRHMQRIKLAAGRLTARQAVAVADIADAFAGGRVHLTTRGSMELHDIADADLADVGKRLADAGLATRGACGGAVRGISCSSSGTQSSPTVQAFCQKLHDHFTGNPEFEDLPKKFKISVDAGYFGSRHLIQDAGLVLARIDGPISYYDLWAGGGLGREPRPGFLLFSGIPEDAAITIIEEIIRTYRAHTPAGKRLKHLIATIGEQGFRTLLNRPVTGTGQVNADSAPTNNPSRDQSPIRIEVGIFAGELSTAILRGIADIATRFADGTLTVTADQNITLYVATIEQATDTCDQLTDLGLGGTTPAEKVVFRVCPGNHDCRMGLAPTRTIARELINRMNSSSCHRTWAIAGCHNSCSQPQLAEIGISTARLVKEEDGTMTPRFTVLCRTSGTPFAEPRLEDVTLEALLEATNTLAG